MSKNISDLCTTINLNTKQYIIFRFRINSKIGLSISGIKKIKNKQKRNKTDKVSTGWKRRFPKIGNLLETTRNRDNSSFPVVSIFGKPLWFPLGFHTWKQSTRGFHLVFSHWKLQETSQMVFTNFHTCKLLVKFTDTKLTADFSKTCTMFSNHQFHNNHNLKVMEMTIGLKTSPFHI